MSRVVLLFVMIAFTAAGAVAKETGRAAPAAAEGINLRKTVTVQVVAQTKDAVVNISTTKLISRRISPFGGDPFFQQFEAGEMVRVPANSLGSGFIVHPDGYVVTNNHVIDRARQITVELADGRKLPAELISSDADADLAILKISSDKPLPILELGDSGDLMIGEPVIAVGNPLGFSHTVSTGIVSALHRDLKNNDDKTMLADLIQTDAAINPGNSGGPLLNAYGQVIGINTAIRGDAQNIGFSIPIDRLRDLIPELMNPASARKIEIPIRFKEQRKVEPPAAVLTHVLTDEEKPRVVTAIDGRAVHDIVDAYAALLRARLGDKLQISFAGAKEPLVVATRSTPVPDAILEARKRLGITIVPLTPMLSEKYHLSAEDGLFVSEVLHDSVAARAGLMPGDVILQLGRYRVNSLDDFAAILHRLPATGRVRIGVLRGDQIGFGTLEW